MKTDIQTGFHEDSGFREILNTVFDGELIQTGFHEGGYIRR